MVHDLVGSHGRMYGLIAMHGLVAMHIRIAHGLNFMDDWAMWLNFRNDHMQLKVKGMQLKTMQLKVGMQNNIWGKKNQEGAIYVFTLFSLVFYSLLLSD